MLYVDFHKECGVGFQLIGNYFLLGDGEVGHIKGLKPAVETHFREIFGVEHINWRPIDEFMAANETSFGKHEDWNEVATKLSFDHRTAHQMAWILLKQRKGLVPLSKSSLPDIRALVASFGYRLNYLMTDKNQNVRATVAEQGHGLETLIRDESSLVRSSVAEQKYGLERLYKDKAVDVRCAVARQGYNLPILISDKSPNVRAEVYRQGFGWDILEKDESVIVKKAIREFKEENFRY